MTWRKTQHLHLIHACDAIYPCYDPAMPSPDLNLLAALDVLLNEGSVARATLPSFSRTSRAASRL
ncbi:LysR family transcriptional regulator, partial [Mesorhizobium sp. M4B.F.Ca.ET.017.02.2.1]